MGIDELRRALVCERCKREVKKRSDFIITIIVLCKECGGVHDLTDEEQHISELVEAGNRQIDWVRGLNPSRRWEPNNKANTTDSGLRMKRILDSQKGITKATDL